LSAYLKNIKITHKELEKKYAKAARESVIDLTNIYSKDLTKQRLLISLEPTIESLKTDINKAIRRVKTLEFYLEDISQKIIVYWGFGDNDVEDFLQHENIKMFGLYETLYYADEKLKDINGNDLPF